MANEGYLLWSQVPGDLGGETFSGISRRAWPAWAGWPLIDAAKQQPGFPGTLATTAALVSLVGGFYRANYWMACRCDDLGDQSVAQEVFDLAVNCGAGAAAKYLQRALNCSWEPGSLFPAVAVDGQIGQTTVSAVQAALAREAAQELTNALNAFAAAHYVTLAEGGEQKFFRGWLRRVAILPVTRG